MAERVFVTGAQGGGAGMRLLVNGRPMTRTQLQAAIRSQGKSLKSAIAVTNKMASVKLYQWVMMNFKGEGDLAGGWAPLSYQALAYKEEHGYEMMLQNTGALRSSFIPYSDESVALIGSALGYSEKHQMGDDGPPRLPKRRLLPTGEEVKQLTDRIYRTAVKVVTSKKW